MGGNAGVITDPLAWFGTFHAIGLGCCPSTPTRSISDTQWTFFVLTGEYDSLITARMADRTFPADGKLGSVGESVGRTDSGLRCTTEPHLRQVEDCSAGGIYSEIAAWGHRF